MSDWRKTGCILCAQNCGLEILVENSRMTKVRPDKDNPRSQGYACRKGMNILNYQYPAGRLTQPLKREGNAFVPISWDQAFREIAASMRMLVDTHGPRCLAYMGASSQGGHFEASFGLTLLRAMGSQYLYSSTAQEFSGAWWVNGRMFGKQYNIPIPDEKETEMFVGWGWNGMQSHQLPQAPRFLKQISEDPNRLLVIIDPRCSETAELADIHLAIRPGTDALLIKAMIAMILDNGWENLTYLENHAEGLTQIRALFAGFDSREAINLCELDYQQVATLCRLMTEKKWCLHPDLGIYMGRQSAINSYLLNILGTICGIFGVRGGNIVPGMVMPLGSHADERNDRVWRTVTTNMFPASAGAFPPAVMPDEILSDHPQRVRAVYVNGCNPLRSYPDTSAYEKAFEKLDLLVVSDIVMSETARFAHYVLPCKNGYESWDASFFAWTYPEVYFQMRQPLVDAPGESKEASEIFTELADHLGIIPEIPQEVKEAAADVDQRRFALSLMKWAKKEPTIRAKMVFILARTLGQKWQSANKAALWGMLMTAPRSLKENAVRTGFTDSPELGQKLFAAIVENPQGLWIGQADTANPMAGIETKSGKVEMVIEELTETVQHLDARSEQEALTLPPEYPLILSAGRHMQCNANTLMRNPQWNEGKRACTVAINPEDASRLNLSDGEQVRVTTAAGFEIGELEVTDRVRPRTVLIPHGFGLVYEGKVFGLNVNRLTPGSNRDFLGTPLHRFIPCRLEKI